MLPATSYSRSSGSNQADTEIQIAQKYNISIKSCSLHGLHRQQSNQYVKEPVLGQARGVCEPVQALNHSVLGQVELVDKDDVAAAHGRHQRPIHPLKRRARGRRAGACLRRGRPQPLQLAYCQGASCVKLTIAGNTSGHSCCQPKDAGACLNSCCSQQLRISAVTSASVAAARLLKPA